MNLQQRINLLVRLGNYMKSDDAAWTFAKEEATQRNSWFTEESVGLASTAIAEKFLQKSALENWVGRYSIPPQNPAPKTVGIVMAGNIPLVGFHDFLAVFVSGHRQLIKPSSKDETLIRHLTDKIIEWYPEAADYIGFAEMLKNADAYIATGSNNSSRYFDFYFAKYPHIIRKSRSSVAILDGTESAEELEKLADDVHLYFGRGCRNVSKLFVPEGYDFIPLLQAFKKYNYYLEHHKYKNNYDYNLALLLLNKQVYMSSESMLLVESDSIAAPIGQLHYAFYQDPAGIAEAIEHSPQVQCVVGLGRLKPGSAQAPELTDYADGIDTMAFLMKL